MPVAKKSEETRTILVLLKNGGRRRVSGIPSNAKITYAPVSPGSREYGGGNALRIYTSESNQLAVFLNVEEFRDLSLVVEEERVTVKAKRSSETAADGSKLESETEESRTWEVVS